MSKPIVVIHNLETNEIIEREMTNEEYAQYKIDEATEQTRLDAENIKVQTRAALLAKLGITEEEAQLLLGGN